MPDLPQAEQTYKPENKPGKRIVRTAQCPLHSKAGKNGKLTGAPGVFRGIQPSLENKEYWAFACHHFGTKREHIFLALPARSAPSTPEEVAAWTQGQLSQRIQKTQGKRQ